VSNETEQVDLSNIDVGDVIKMVGEATDEQLDEGMKGPQREEILAEVFRQIGDHYRPGPGADDAVIHWVITGRPDGGEDRWQVKLHDGKCDVSKDGGDDPRVTFTMDGPTFMRLVTGNAQGPMLFISGKLKISGDIPFAARVQSFFEIPKG
jgi:hypothetical protein